MKYKCKDGVDRDKQIDEYYELDAMVSFLSDLKDIVDKKLKEAIDKKGDIAYEFGATGMIALNDYLATVLNKDGDACKIMTVADLILKLLVVNTSKQVEVQSYGDERGFEYQPNGVKVNDKGVVIISMSDG